MTTLGRNPIEGSIKPLGSKVLLQPKGRAERTSGGILLPADAQLNTSKQEWLVLAVGPKVTDIVPGEYVLFRMEFGGHSLDDGTGRVLADFKDCSLAWRESPQTPASAFGGDQP
jgi:co-chaperonin GroES (HSP10)